MLSRQNHLLSPERNPPKPIHPAANFSTTAGTTSSRVYQTFDEDLRVWARDIRNLSRGRAIIRLVDDPKLYDVDVKRSAPGYLAFDTATLREEMPEVLDEVDQMIDRNFQSSLFASPKQIETEMQ